MKLIIATLTLLTLATASPLEAVELKPLPEKTYSGCYHYTIPKADNCCLPRLCACKDGAYYQFNDDAWAKTMNGCNPPWGYLGKKMHDIPGFCCKGWKAPKPTFPN